MSDEQKRLKNLKDEAYKALYCLYLATNTSVADDVNAKVKAYIEALEAEQAGDDTSQTPIPREKCPDCGNDEFEEGPCGGGSQNVRCRKCGQWWNFMGPAGFERIGPKQEAP